MDSTFGARFVISSILSRSSGSKVTVTSSLSQVDLLARVCSSLSILVFPGGLVTSAFYSGRFYVSLKDFSSSLDGSYSTGA